MLTKLTIRNFKQFQDTKEIELGNSVVFIGPNNSGKTTAVQIFGDGGSTSFDATEFKNWFNLRAPANIQIVGPLFNIEQK